MGLAAGGAILAFFWVRGSHPLDAFALPMPVMLFIALWRFTVLSEKRSHSVY
jgi:hypothetical protein